MWLPFFGNCISLSRSLARFSFHFCVDCRFFRAETHVTRWFGFYHFSHSNKYVHIFCTYHKSVSRHNVTNSVASKPHTESTTTKKNSNQLHCQPKFSASMHVPQCDAEKYLLISAFWTSKTFFLFLLLCIRSSGTFWFGIVYQYKICLVIFVRCCTDLPSTLSCSCVDCFNRKHICHSVCWNRPEKSENIDENSVHSKNDMSFHGNYCRIKLGTVYEFTIQANAHYFGCTSTYQSIWIL